MLNLLDVNLVSEMSKEKGNDSKRKETGPRRVVSGPIREKEKSMRRLITAVGKVIQEKGYTALGGASIAKEAGLNKSLIYKYFGGVDQLVEIYILQRDFWNMADKVIVSRLLEKPENIGSREIAGLLLGQLDGMVNDKILQKIIHWELGEKNKTLRKISDKREEIGEQLFQIIESDFDNTGIDIRAKLALQIGGIYYLVLHAKNNGSLFCGLDINKPKDLERLRNAIEDNVLKMYQERALKK
jgi:AcrR family transcriptional regulator